MKSSTSLFVASVVIAAACLTASTSRAQSCCSGGTAVTPARLAPHEDALVGLQTRAARVIGSFDPRGVYTASPDRQTESDYEADLLAAIRLFSRAQLSLLVPYEITRRSVPGTSSTGSGLGDINVGGRYDLSLAGSSETWPGVAVLAGVTLPTGRPPESARKPLATDATGIGAFQGVLGLSLEQTFGPVFVGLSGLVARRSSRHVLGVSQTPGMQGILAASTAYAFDSGAALGLGFTWASEASPVVDGVVQPDGGRRQLLASVLGLYPFRDWLRLQGSAFVTPWFHGGGVSQTGIVGMTLAVVLTWS